MERSLRGSRILVTGAAGQLGRYLVPTARSHGAEVIAAGSRPGQGIDVFADLADPIATMRMVDDARPDVIIHGAACTDVDGVEREPERGERGNALATCNLVEAARRASAYLLAVSTDMVFAGDGGAPYSEYAVTIPISHYGNSKLTAEESVLHGSPGFGVARTAWLYGGSGKHFPRTVLTVLRDRGAIEVVDDEIGSPTFAGDLADALVDLAAMRGAGVFHLVNAGSASRYDVAAETARLAGLDTRQVKPVSTAEFLSRFPLPARRPPNSSLANVRAAGMGVSLRNWRDALAAYAPVLSRELDASQM